MDLTLFKNLSKYPFVFEHTFHDSVELKQNKTCSNRCDLKDCRILFSESNHLQQYRCSKGYDNILLIIGRLRFIINGLIYIDNKTVPQGRKLVRAEWIVNREDVILFSNKIKEIENYLDKSILETTEKNFSMFHDFKTSMSIFFNCTEDIINSLPGGTFEEKFKNSGQSYKNLYNSLALITSQLGMIDVIINPRSIQFGNKKSINLYRLFEKIKILFGHLTTRKRDISINIISEAWIKDCSCYESIEFIPLILLDNALKYSVPDSEIEIKLEQNYNSVKVIVKNIGPYVSDENKDKIFDKFFRDDSGKSFSKEGIGMGLWIAQEILEAHGSKLSYFKDNHKGTIGLNIFSFDLKFIT